MNEELVLKNEPRKWFLEMEITPDEDAGRIAEMTTKDTTYNQLIKQGLRGLTPNAKRVLV